MKLKIGSIFLVHGWVMMKGLESGCTYQVESMPDYRGMDTYQFHRVGCNKNGIIKIKGRKKIRHYAHDIDTWIREKDHPDLNRIEVIKL